MAEREVTLEILMQRIEELEAGNKPTTGILTPQPCYSSTPAVALNLRQSIEKSSNLFGTLYETMNEDLISFEPKKEQVTSQLKSNVVANEPASRQDLWRFTDSMGNLLERFTELSNTPKTPKAVLKVTFSGRVEESPELFLFQVRQYLKRVNAQDEADKIAITRGQLKGEASTWADLIRDAPVEYSTFCTRFLDEYNSIDRLVTAYARLYSETQKDQEPVEKFITTKQALLARLKPNMTPEITVGVVIRLLRPAIASRIGGARPMNLEGLIQVAKSIEPDVAREYKDSKRAVPAISGFAPSIRPCRWCRGNHYDRECPQGPTYDPRPSQGRGLITQNNNSNRGNLRSGRGRDLGFINNQSTEERTQNSQRMNENPNKRVSFQDTRMSQGDNTREDRQS